MIIILFNIGILVLLGKWQYFISIIAIMYLCTATSIIDIMHTNSISIVCIIRCCSFARQNHHHEESYHYMMIIIIDDEDEEDEDDGLTSPCLG